MLFFVIRRIASTVPVLVMVALIVFMILRLTPGDPAAALVGDNGTSADIARTPVILIHGFIGTLDIVQFEPEYATPDLLGYGDHRSVPFGQISLTAQVEHIRSFVDTRFGARRVDVVGHSVGGAIALWESRRHIGRVDFAGSSTPDENST
jgi:pimeloyl-ACP methyl ester carboxylesterase